jgi:branched-chain amino acid transport system ATP-binding protein
MLLKINNLQVYIDSLYILKDINICLNKGEFVAVIGSNGSGKSTLLRTIMGLVKPKMGTIEFDGIQIHGNTPYDIALKGISLMPEGRCLFQDMTVLENLQMGGYLYRKDKGYMKKRLKWIYELFPILEKYKEHKASLLSGGEQQFVNIGRGLMSNPKLLMIDELSLGLAPKIVDTLFETLKNLNSNGMTILIVEQNALKTLQNVDRTYILDVGRIIIEGKSEIILKDDNVKNVYLGTL